jgi:hypothetical protein
METYSNATVETITLEYFEGFLDIERPAARKHQKK